MEYVQKVPGHTNSQDEKAPWVIKDHETHEILKSFKSKEDAENALQQMHIHEGMSPNYREPYSYRQNATETFDDMGNPSSALETRKGFDLMKTYDRARKGWPTKKTAPISEDGDGGGGDAGGGVAGNAANLSTGTSIGDSVPMNALSVRTLRSRGLGKAKRGTIDNEWDSAYDALSETSDALQSLIQYIHRYRG